MRPSGPAVPLLLSLLAFLLAAHAAAEPRGAPSTDPHGKVTLPLSRWQAMEDAVRSSKEAPRAGPTLWIDRHMDGRFHKGLWSGRLTGRFEVEGGGRARVPVIDAGATVGEATLDGEPATLLAEDGMYTVGVEGAGRHELSVDFHWGRETQRFTRNVRIKLPEGGPLALTARIAERDVEASLAGGALTGAAEEGSDTVVHGHLDGAGALDLSWQRRREAEAKGEARLRAHQDTVFTVSEARIVGRSADRFEVIEGEAGEVSLDVPRGVEIMRVEGDAVLQWRTALAAGENAKLIVLLRHLVSDAASIKVDFQLPVEPDAPVALAMPAPEAPTAGTIGVIGPPGLSVAAKEAEGAEPLAPRDLPADLTALTESPVLLGYRFDRAPRVVLTVARLPELALASTLVDELQASTVLLEDGTERTKVKLSIRNSARQYVEITLPGGAELTHSFIDGRKVRPAVKGGALLFPLRRSERLAAGGERVHVVRPGETLSDVANLYYSDPSAWSRIVSLNRDVVSESGALTRGARLRIPPATEAAGQEASFVIELAYERATSRLGAIGLRALRLPGLDVDTVKAVWHVFLPGSHEPLSWSGNLTQCSGIKYDLFRRVQWYLEQAIAVPSAWAGGDYKNILVQRRKIYDDEAQAHEDDGTALTTFPLVGERTRFRRILLGREVAEIRVTYASSGVVSAARHGALLIAFGVTLWALLRGRRAPRRWIVAAAAFAGLLVVAHHVPGIHRRLLWGADLALLFALIRAYAPWLRRAARIAIRAPWRVARGITARRLLAAAGFTWLLGLVASYPMLLSAAALAGMSLAWWRAALAKTSKSPPHAHEIPEAPHAR